MVAWMVVRMVARMVAVATAVAVTVKTSAGMRNPVIPNCWSNSETDRKRGIRISIYVRRPRTLGDLPSMWKGAGTRRVAAQAARVARVARSAVPRERRVEV